MDLQYEDIGAGNHYLDVHLLPLGESEGAGSGGERQNILRPFAGEKVHWTSSP